MDKDIDVSDDHLLLQILLDEYQIPVKQLAQLTGRGASTVYKYCAGEATIPTIVWRVLYEKTKDQRIVKLITGELPVAVVPLAAEKIKLDKPTIKRLIEDRKGQIRCEQCVLDIIADGRIDRDDRQAVELYKVVFPQTIQSLYQTYLAIIGEYERMLK